MMVFNISGGTTEETRLIWKLAGLGFQFGTEIIAGMLLGWLVDRWLGTEPWGVVVGAIAGIAVAMMHLFRSAVQLNREMDAGLVRTKQSKPRVESEDDETHEQWKGQRDRELLPNTDGNETDGSDARQRGDESGGRRGEG